MMRRPVWVRWTDACHIGPGTWVDDDGLQNPGVTVHTVGILVRKTKTHMVLAHSFDGELLTGVFSIPRSAVEDWGELHE